MAKATARRTVAMVPTETEICDWQAGIRKNNDGYLYRPDLPPGSAHIKTLSDESIVFTWVCPCGCAAVHFVLLNPPPGAHGWQWNGDRERPTLSPSLGMHPKDGNAFDGSGYHWHGHLTGGVFEEC